MTTLKTRLLTLFALVLATFVVGQSSGVGPADAHALPLVTLFTDIGAGLTGVFYGSVAWGDYNSDGRPDALVTGASVSGLVAKVYRNNGDGSFTDIGAALPGVEFSSVAWGDYNNDGRPDILITGMNATPAPIALVFRNNGDGTFTDIGAGFSGVFYGSAAWGDYNNDGRPDVVITGLNATAAPTAKLYRNNGDGTFTEIGTDLTGVYYGSVAWGDYNSDGHPDILLTGVNASSTPVAKIFRNNGDGSFTNIGAALPGVYYGSVAWGDYNSDGRPDIALSGIDASSTYLARVYRNNEDGSFTDIGAGFTGVAAGATAWGDYNSDGRPDLLLSGVNASSVATAGVFQNNGDGSFTDIGAGLTGVYYSSAGWADYNSDGRPDILLTGASTSSIVSSIYRNDAPGSNSVPNAPSGLKTQLTSDGRITFSWDAASDAQTAAAALTYNLRVGTTPGGSQLVSPEADSSGLRHAVGPGNVGARTSFTLSGLGNGKFYWSVQTVDSSFAGSAFAKEQAFSVPSAVSVQLTRNKILSCGKKTRSATVTGLIAAAPPSAASVTLQERATARANWRSVSTEMASASGVFSFAKVGLGSKHSLWVRVVSKAPSGAKVASNQLRLAVKNTCKRHKSHKSHKK